MSEKTIWGIHAGKTGDVESLFLQNKVIALGWQDFGSLDGLMASDEFKQKYAHVYPDASPQGVATSAGQLFRFVHEVNIGDLVIFPAKGDRHVHIGEISGDYIYRPEIEKGYPNQRSVKWLEHVPRTRFSQGALYEMGAAMSLF